MALQVTVATETTTAAATHKLKGRSLSGRHSRQLTIKHIFIVATWAKRWGITHKYVHPRTAVLLRRLTTWPLQFTRQNSWRYSPPWRTSALKGGPRTTPQNQGDSLSTHEIVNWNRSTGGQHHCLGHNILLAAKPFRLLEAQHVNFQATRLANN